MTTMRLRVGAGRRPRARRGGQLKQSPNQSKDFFTQKDKETEIKGIQFEKARLPPRLAPSASVGAPGDSNSLSRF